MIINKRTKKFILYLIFVLVASIFIFGLRSKNKAHNEFIMIESNVYTALSSNSEEQADSLYKYCAIIEDFIIKYPINVDHKFECNSIINQDASSTISDFVKYVQEIDDIYRNADRKVNRIKFIILFLIIGLYGLVDHVIESRENNKENIDK